MLLRGSGAPLRAGWDCARQRRCARGGIGRDAPVTTPKKEGRRLVYRHAYPIITLDLFCLSMHPASEPQDVTLLNDRECRYPASCGLNLSWTSQITIK